MLSEAIEIHVRASLESDDRSYGFIVDNKYLLVDLLVDPIAITEFKANSK